MKYEIYLSPLSILTGALLWFSKLKLLNYLNYISPLNEMFCRYSGRDGLRDNEYSSICVSSNLYLTLVIIIITFWKQLQQNIPSKYLYDHACVDGYLT